MRHFILAAAAMIAVPSAALACSCLDTDDPAQLRSLAPDSVKNAVAVVEVEALSAFEPVRGGEQMQVVQTLAGSAPKVFKVERGPFPSSASCDVLFEKGQRGTVILYPASSGAAPVPTYRISSSCTAHLLSKPVFRDEVLRLMSPSSQNGERGR